jgi:hypothetical protein
MARILSSQQHFLLLTASHFRLQYRSARLLLQTANQSRVGLLPKRNNIDWLLESLGIGLIRILSIPDRLRMMLFDRTELRKHLTEQSQLESDYVIARMTDNELSWTTAMAFYALGGGCVFQSKYIRGKTLCAEALGYLVRHDPKSLLRLQKAVLQDPSKADAITKTITCLQALWFCSQCFSRLAEGMAITLTSVYGISDSTRYRTVRRGTFVNFSILYAIQYFLHLESYIPR